MYLGTLVLSPWLGFHPRLWFLAFTVAYAVERAVTVKARGWKIQLFSAAVFPEWFYDPFPAIGPGPRPVGRGLADQQILVALNKT